MIIPMLKLTAEAHVSDGARKKKVKRHLLQSRCRRRFSEKFKFIIVDRTTLNNTTDDATLLHNTYVN